MGRILLIEDEESAQLLFKNRLQDLGHEVVTASTGAEGLLEARAGTFDLFLVDVVLGSGIDGYEVCRRIKAIPQKHGIPVVIISGQLKNREDLHRGYEAGCEAFLIKGDLPLIEDTVRAMLHLKSLQDDLALQNRLLEQQNRRLQEERQRGADLETALRETGNRSTVFRELAAGRPDGILLVNTEGIVRFADRGATGVLGKDLEGRQLGSLFPETGLEAFVRDAKTEPREAFRFDVSTHGGRTVRQISASVVPMLPLRGARHDDGLRVVLLLDAGKRRVAAEMLRLQEQGIPRREIGPLLEAARLTFHRSGIVGRSAAAANLRRAVQRAAATAGPTLLVGEPGTGKGLAARAIHFGGNKSGAFVPVNCAALTPSSLESELFGHVKGAFDGAISDRSGLFQQAQFGTIYLDGVDALTPDLQAKLECVLRDGEVTPVGSSEVGHVQVHVIAAAEQDLGDLVRAGRFRESLRELLSGGEIPVPALRERREDVLVLAERFLRRFDPEDETRLSDAAARVLESYDWPGNVRELEAAIERACALAADPAVLSVGDLPQPLRDLSGSLPAREREPAAALPSAAARDPDRGTLTPRAPAEGERRALSDPGAPSARGALGDPDLEVSLEAYEKLCLEAALRRTHGDKLAAARMLKVGKSTLYRKLKAHGIK